MPPTQPPKYDAFISYSSKDRPWAKQLADDLTARNFNVFFDKTSLPVGEEWQNQLELSLDGAKHLIVLWTRNASESKHVDFERTFFHSRSRPRADDAERSQRKEIMIMFEDPAPLVRGTLQTIKDLQEAQAYAKGFDKRDPNLWASVVSQIEKTIRNNSNDLPILVAILATTREFLKDLNFDKRIKYLRTPNEVIAEMGISSKEELLKHYGPTRDEWKPFGDDVTIWTILESLRVRVANATEQKLKIAWEPIGADLWSETNITIAKNEAYRLAKGLSLVIIDPISLFDSNVTDVLDLVEGCFSNTNSAIMILTPYKTRNGSLRNIIETRAMSIQTKFYQPPVPPKLPFANFGVNIGDEIDMNRLVLMTLGQYFGEQKTKNIFTNP